MYKTVTYTIPEMCGACHLCNQGDCAAQLTNLLASGWKHITCYGLTSHKSVEYGTEGFSTTPHVVIRSVFSAARDMINKYFLLNTWHHHACSAVRCWVHYSVIDQEARLQPETKAGTFELGLKRPALV